ncbi:P-loop containing nucleoside triphosphate hydrolase protein [Favolaschia claudopus]|uniref:P-loop containing nucleoside triphosphate hydrolase protein n=1 Tax=Favolaschia claudopus TaxID=2862362 RepID=A0AAV9Z088_9AGAR
MDQWTIAVLGDGGVGKTALAVQFTLNCFVGQFPVIFRWHCCRLTIPTIEDAYRKQFVLDNSMCLLSIEEYGALRDQWVREGQGFILVYSIASRSSFDRLELFREAARRVKTGNPILMLAGNKADKLSEREVSKEEGAALAQQFGCDFMETSAKTTQNVERVFANLVRALRQTRNSKPGVASKNRGCIIL